MRARSLVLLTPLIVVGSSVAASAEPSAFGATPTIPTLHIELIFNASYHKVCFSGAAAAAGTWTSSMTGSRSDGSAFTPLPATGSGTTFLHCETMNKNGAAYGTHAEQLSYSGSTGSVTFTVAGNGTWDSANNDYGATTG